jgi:hypothetical protein
MIISKDTISKVIFNHVLPDWASTWIVRMIPIIIPIGVTIASVTMYETIWQRLMPLLTISLPT